MKTAKHVVHSIHQDGKGNGCLISGKKRVYTSTYLHAHLFISQLFYQWQEDSVYILHVHVSTCLYMYLLVNYFISGWKRVCTSSMYLHVHV